MAAVCMSPLLIAVSMPVEEKRFGSLPVSGAGGVGGGMQIQRSLQGRIGDLRQDRIQIAHGLRRRREVADVTVDARQIERRANGDIAILNGKSVSKRVFAIGDSFFVLMSYKKQAERPSRDRAA